MFDPRKIFDMVKNAGEMQKNLSDKMRQQTATGEAAGGMVKATMNGHFELINLEIDDSLIKKEDKAFLADLIKAAVNDATRQLRTSLADHLKALTGSFGL